MINFTILSSALDKPAKAPTAKDALELALELALKFDEEFKVFVDLKDKSEVIGIIFGDKVKRLSPYHDLNLTPITKGKPERE